SSGWTAVNVAILSGAAPNLLTPRRALDIAASRRQGFDDRGEMRDSLVGATNHHAMPALNPPDAPAGTHIHILDALPPQGFGTTDVVFEHGVAPIDDDVTGLQQRTQFVHASFRDLPCRQHQPHGLWGAQFTNHVCD